MKFKTLVQVCSFLGAFFVIVVAPEFVHLRPGQPGFTAEFRKIAWLGLVAIWSPAITIGIGLGLRSLLNRSGTSGKQSTPSSLDPPHH